MSGRVIINSIIVPNVCVIRHGRPVNYSKERARRAVVQNDQSHGAKSHRALDVDVASPTLPPPSLAVFRRSGQYTPSDMPRWLTLVGGRLLMAPKTVIPARTTSGATATGPPQRPAVVSTRQSYKNYRPSGTLPVLHDHAPVVGSVLLRTAFFAASIPSLLHVSSLLLVSPTRSV